MSCAPYKNALVEAAASGSEPLGELRAHLAACPACRATFAQEQSLFSSIDTGLHAAVNVEVPASLFPRVRTHIAETVPQRTWTRSLPFATVTAALAFAIFLFARPHHADPANQAKQTPQSPVTELPVANTGHSNSDPATQIASSNVNNSQTPRHPTLLRTVASSQPEVLVPPDEREAYSRFIFTVQQRRDLAAALLAPSPKKQDAPVTLELLQIADLELKPLEGRETEIAARVGEQR